MKGFPNRNTVEELRRQYPPGTRIVLDSCDDPYASMPKGMEGTVLCVDDAGGVHTRWDNGSGLALIYGHDSWHRKNGGGKG